MSYGQRRPGRELANRDFDGSPCRLGRGKKRVESGGFDTGSKPALWSSMMAQFKQCSKSSNPNLSELSSIRSNFLIVMRMRKRFMGQDLVPIRGIQL